MEELNLCTTGERDMPVVFAEEWDTPGHPNQHRTAATRTLFCVAFCILYSRSRSLLGLISWTCKSHDRKELPSTGV